MKDEELELINNVAQKLEIYMQRNNTTVFSLARSMNIDKQPFYRIINRKNVPNISSLFLISNNLDCSIQELISENVFLDIKTYKDISLVNEGVMYRIYISYKDYQDISSYQVFGIITERDLQIYSKTESFINDGLYIVKYNNEIIEMDVLSAGSKFVIANIQQKECRLESNLIIPIAKKYKTVPVIANEFCILSPKREKTD